MQTPSPHTRFGIKGMGEGGAIAPPAAVLNAVNDALAPLRALVDRTPITPDRVLAAIEAVSSTHGNAAAAATAAPLAGRLPGAAA